MTQRKRSSGTCWTSGSTSGFTSPQHSAKECAVLGTWRNPALFQPPGGSAGTESKAPYQQLLQHCANSHEIRRDQCSGLRWMVISFLSWLTVRREISAAIDQQLWAQAAQHEQGKGLQQGIDLHATRLHLVRLRKRGQHKEANFLMACLTGALWPLQRQHECPRSGESPLDPARVARRAVLRLSCTVIGYVLEICLTIPMKRRSRRTRDFLVELLRRQLTHPVCGSEASFQLNIRQGCCHRRLLRRQQWSLGQEELPRLATSFETTRCIGTQTAAAGNMAKMRDLSELVGVQSVSRAKCPLTAQKFGLFFNCWSVLWVIWLLAQTAIILSSAFISDGGLARAASRMATCGVESGPHSIAGAKSLSTNSGRMCWLLILLLIWQLTPGQALWAMNLLTLLLRKVLFSMRSRWTWLKPSARPILWQSAYRSSFTPRPYRPSTN